MNNNRPLFIFIGRVSFYLVFSSKVRQKTCVFTSKTAVIIGARTVFDLHLFDLHQFIYFNFFQFTSIYFNLFYLKSAEKSAEKLAKNQLKNQLRNRLKIAMKIMGKFVKMTSAKKKTKIICKMARSQDKYLLIYWLYLLFFLFIIQHQRNIKD